MGQRDWQAVVISFGCVTTGGGNFWDRAAPSLQRVIESDSLLMRRHEPESVAVACNEMLEEAVRQGDLECVVLVDENGTIQDADFMQRVRLLLDEGGDVALIGPEGTLLMIAAAPAAEIRLDSGIESSLDACIAGLMAEARVKGWRVVTPT